MILSERRSFQAAVAVAGLVPVVAGAAGAVVGQGFVGQGFVSDGFVMEGLLPGAAPDMVSLGSHFRYLSGLLLGIGVAFWMTIPRPEAHTARFRLLTAIVFLGGLARLWGIAADGVPPAPMLFGLAMELAVTPALCLWQARIAQR